MQAAPYPDVSVAVEAREEWRPAPRHEALYSVSNQGRIRAEPRLQARSNGRPLNRRSRVLRPKQTARGDEIRLENEHHVKVDHLVLEAFWGPRPHGSICHHLNGDLRDNRLQNLVWLDPRQVSPIPNERWLPIPDWEERYSVSDHGRVLGIERIALKKGHPCRVLPHLLTPCPDPFGYPRVQLYRPPKYVGRRLHELVLAAFVGPRPKGQVCRHLDGDPSNNALYNLTYGSHTDNMADAARHGTIRRGEDNPQAKLSVDQVVEIREMRDQGVTQRVVAQRFGISQTLVRHIMLGKAWRHLP